MNSKPRCRNRLGTNHTRTVRRSVAACSFALIGLFSVAVLAAGDAAAGKRVYDLRCLGCHGGDGTAPTLGPSLVGIIGRKAGTEQTGVHSRAMVDSDITWSASSLRKFLAAPTKQVPGTIMPTGVPNAQEIDDLVAYLQTLR